MQKAGHYLDSLAAGIDVPLEEEELCADQLKEYLFYAGALQAVCRRQEMLQLQLEKAEAQVVSYITEKDNVQKGECKYKGKAIPLQAWSGHEGSRRLRLPDFKTIGT
jgi:sorting nexin-4